MKTAYYESAKEATPFRATGNPMSDDLAPILRKLRTEKGLTQRQLAAIIEVDPSFIAHIEMGKRDAGYATLRRWLEACDATLEIHPQTTTGLSPALAQLVEAAQSLSEEDLARLAKMARGIPLVNKMMKDAIAEDWGSRGERAETEEARKRA